MPIPMEKKKCPYCGEEIAVTAKKCRFCGEWLVTGGVQPSGQEQSTAAPSQPPTPSPSAQPATVEAISPVTPVTSPPPAYNSEETTSSATEESTKLPSFFDAYFVNPYVRRYADFKGYTSRKSFWLTYVATMILSVGLGGLILLLSSFGVGGITAGSIIGGLIGLALVIPSLALCVRRLRDADKNPWLLLLALIPAIGSIILVIFFCKESEYEDTEEEGHWQMPDWIVTGACVVLMVLGIILSARSLTDGSDYDLGSFGDTEEEAYPVEADEAEVEEVVEEDYGYGNNGNVPSLVDIADHIDPQYFTYELTTYRMGSDKKMDQLYMETGSTNVPIEATGMISSHNISMKGWITEEGTIHGRYHNENGINLDFNGYIRRDNSLYIQLGHDGEKSDWILYPVPSELPSGSYRYEGKWGKSQKDSFVTFTEE